MELVLGLRSETCKSTRKCRAYVPVSVRMLMAKVPQEQGPHDPILAELQLAHPARVATRVGTSFELHISGRDSRHGHELLQPCSPKASKYT